MNDREKDLGGRRKINCSKKKRWWKYWRQMFRIFFTFRLRCGNDVVIRVMASATAIRAFFFLIYSRLSWLLIEPVNCIYLIYSKTTDHWCKVQNWMRKKKISFENPKRQFIKCSFLFNCKTKYIYILNFFHKVQYAWP